MMDPVAHRDILCRAESMKFFAGKDEKLVFGQWRRWYQACLKAGTTLPPEDFKQNEGETE